jgi:hypothetical protein
MHDDHDDAPAIGLVAARRARCASSPGFVRPVAWSTGIRCRPVKVWIAVTNRSVSALKTTGERIGLPHTSRRKVTIAPGICSVGM